MREIENSRIRPHHRREVEASPVAELDCPPGLTAEESGLWAFYMPLLASRRVLTEADRDILANHCIALAQIADIRRQQQAPEYRRLVLSVTVDGAGNEHVKATTNPLDAQLRHWLQLARLSAAELGLTPVSRARAWAAGPSNPEGDDLDAFINASIRRVK